MKSAVRVSLGFGRIKDPIPMFNGFSGSIKQIGIIFAPLSTSTEDSRLAFNWMKIAIIGNQFQLINETSAMKIVQLL
jgi:hypothetical protein